MTKVVGPSFHWNNKLWKTMDVHNRWFTYLMLMMLELNGLDWVFATFGHWHQTTLQLKHITWIHVLGLCTLKTRFMDNSTNLLDMFIFLCCLSPRLKQVQTTLVLIRIPSCGQLWTYLTNWLTWPLKSTLERFDYFLKFRDSPVSNIYITKHLV